MRLSIRVIFTTAIFQLFIIAANSQTKVKFYTNYGDFIIELYDTDMPITTGNFLSLVDEKFYDESKFHRVIDNFMIQGGKGSYVPPTIQDEFVTGMTNVTATISMANAGPNTGTSQFFINLVNNTYLDFDKDPLEYQHPVFGITTDYFDVVQTIGKVATNSNDAPTQKVSIDSIRLFKLVGVKDLEISTNKLEVFPNPSSDKTQATFNITEASEISLSIFDLQGRKIKSILSGYKSVGRYLESIDLKDLSKGVYILRLSNSTSYVNRQLIKL